MTKVTENRMERRLIGMRLDRENGTEAHVNVHIGEYPNEDGARLLGFEYRYNASGAVTGIVVRREDIDAVIEGLARVQAALSS